MPKCELSRVKEALEKFYGKKEGRRLYLKIRHALEEAEENEPIEG